MEVVRQLSVVEFYDQLRDVLESDGLRSPEDSVPPESSISQRMSSAWGAHGVTSEPDADEDRIALGLDPLPRPGSHFLLLNRFHRAGPAHPPRPPPASANLGPPLQQNPAAELSFGLPSAVGVDELSGPATLLSLDKDGMGRLLMPSAPRDAVVLVHPHTYFEGANKTLSEAASGGADTLKVGDEVWATAIPSTDGVFTVLSVAKERGLRGPLCRKEGIILAKLDDGAWLAHSGQLENFLVLRESLDMSALLAAIREEPGRNVLTQLRAARQGAWLQCGAPVSAHTIPLPHFLRERCKLRKGWVDVERLAVLAVPLASESDEATGSVVRLAGRVGIARLDDGALATFEHCGTGWELGDRLQGRLSTEGPGRATRFRISGLRRLEGRRSVPLGVEAEPLDPNFVGQWPHPSPFFGCENSVGGDVESVAANPPATVPAIKESTTTSVPKSAKAPTMTLDEMMSAQLAALETESRSRASSVCSSLAAIRPPAAVLPSASRDPRPESPKDAAGSDSFQTASEGSGDE